MFECFLRNYCFAIDLDSTLNRFDLYSSFYVGKHRMFSCNAETNVRKPKRYVFSYITSYVSAVWPVLSVFSDILFICSYNLVFIQDIKIRGLRPYLVRAFHTQKLLVSKHIFWDTELHTSDYMLQISMCMPLSGCISCIC